jgi:hypothetical protein
LSRIGEIDRLIVMGGPMGVHDEATFPWLNRPSDEEKLTGDAKNEMKGLGLKGTASLSERDSDFLIGGVLVSLSF